LASQKRRVVCLFCTVGILNSPVDNVDLEYASLPADSYLHSKHIFLALGRRGGSGNIALLSGDGRKRELSDRKGRSRILGLASNKVHQESLREKFLQVTPSLRTELCHLRIGKMSLPCCLTHV
jgi:hypothetical protein